MKILILRFSSIGDIILTTPVVRALAQQCPGAEIHYATKASFAPLLKANPCISKVHSLNGDMPELLKMLRKERFDVVVDLHRNLRTLRIRMAMPGVKWLSFDKSNLQKWMLVRKWTKKPVTHVVHRYMATVAPLGVKYDGQGLDYFIPENTVKPELPETYTAYAIGGTWATKRLPSEKMAGLLAAGKGTWVLLGDKHDAKVAAELEQQFPGKIVNLCGRLSLDQSALVLQHAGAVVSHDSGLMHIATALGKPVWSIWGNTVPAFGMYPFYADSQRDAGGPMFEVSGLSCRPCSKIGYAGCPKGHFRCMMEQDVAAIAASLPEM